MTASGSQRPIVALTGATGFIGRYLLRELPKRGYRMRVLLRRPSETPLDCASAVVGDLARPQNMAAALADADAVIHSAGIAHAMSGVPADDYRLFNTESTIGLAQAAQRAGVRRFVFLSSIRAQCGAWSDTVQTEDLPPRPSDPYGASKLAAEQGLAALDLDWVALRPVVVYGPGVKGNVAQLLRLARLPLPLPLAGLRAQRSLLSLDNLVTAIDVVLSAPAALKRPLIAADAEPLTVGEMIAAMRSGLGRRPGLFAVPSTVLELAGRIAGRPQLFDRIARPLIADAAALHALGWRPSIATAAGLARLMRDNGMDAAEKSVQT